MKVSDPEIEFKKVVFQLLSTAQYGKIETTLAFLEVVAWYLSDDLCYKCSYFYAFFS